MTQSPDDEAHADDVSFLLERLEAELSRTDSATPGSPAPPGSETSLLTARRLVSDLKTLHESRKGFASTTLPGGRSAALPVQPTRLGGYEIRRTVGRGGFAVVYQAWDERLRRDVALKVPLPHRLHGEDSRRRFVQEAQAAARLDHRHIVPTYEAGNDGELPFIAYAFCEGPTLAAWLKSHGPLPPEQAAALLVALASAVQYSHERGILHRDLKPANVLLFPSDGDDTAGLPWLPRLSDFGLAKLLESAASDTGSSVIMGTPLYMAPEQADLRDRRIGPETDVFGLGAVLYEVLSGDPPHKGETVVEVLDAVRNGSIPTLRQTKPGLPRDLVRICEKCLALHAVDRYRTAAALREDLNRFLSSQPIKGRRAGAATRIARVSCHRDRVEEAAGYVMVCNAAILFWISTWPIMIATGYELPEKVEIKDVLPYTIPLFVFHLTALVLGVLMAGRRLWAAVALTLMAAALTLYIFAVLTRMIDSPYPAIYQNELVRDIVFMLLFALFTIQTVLGGCAWAALAADARRKRGGGA